ncbi:unnamed protein product, partial [Mesorhabditis belari]|uniref:Serpentine receptor class gamma n=1 Tax=Mesorhabditis belari TaxID=2138241 RepID=A0AAF3EFC2_9BILA
MSSLVRKYFFVEYASRLYLILFFQLYINPLLFWPEEIGKTPAFIDTLITYLYSVFTLSCPFAQMALSGNRFLAVAFNGRFYYLMSQRETLQVVILIVAPLLLHFPQLLPSCSPYNTDCYGEVGFGGYCPQIAWIAVFAASIFGLITIIMDICVWRMLKKRRKDAHLLNNPGEKTERRLCRHMLLNHVSTLIIGLIVSIISGSLTNDELLQAVIQTNLHVPIAAVVQGPDAMGNVPPFVDTLFTTLYMIFSLLCPLAQMALSCNRLLAIAFNGRFYRFMSQKEIVQIIVLVSTPTLLHLPLLLPWCSLYTDEVYFDGGFGGDCQIILWISEGSTTVIGVFTLLSDICVWLLLRRRRKDLNLMHSPSEKAERRLCYHVSTLLKYLLL